MFKPSHNLVAFEPVEIKKESAGQIVIVDDTKHARVVAVGPGKHLPNGAIRPTCVKVGDYIVFSHMAAGQIRDFMCNGKRVYYCDDQFIDGTVDESDVIAQTPAEPEPMIVQSDLEFKVVTN